MILYVVKSKDGKYLRSKGASGYGKSWVDSIEDAKIYAKLGQARSRVTYWVNNSPQFGIPEIIPLECTKGEPLDEKGRVEKVRESKKMQNAKHEARLAKHQLESARRELERAQARVSELSGERK